MNKKLSFVIISMICTLVFISIIFSTGFRTKYDGVNFNEKIIKLEENKVRMVFSSELNVSDVYINFSVNGNDVNSISMKKNGNLWVCDISEVYANDNIEYWYTYKYKFLYKDTNWLNHCF
jgi:hypothetical protein